MENTTQQTDEVKKNSEELNETAAANPAAENTSSESEKEKPSQEQKLQSELAESKDKYIRLYSEFENFRRRTSKEKLEMIQSANEQLIKALLPVLDDFERAEKSFKEKNDKDSEGFALIQNKFRKVLEQYGVKTMTIERGADFNPDLHEAITQIPAPDEKLKGKVVDVVEKGYLLNEKVIRYAKVVVGN
jgi:molecular chaperone GrpE